MVYAVFILLPLAASLGVLWMWIFGKGVAKPATWQAATAAIAGGIVLQVQWLPLEQLWLMASGGALAFCGYSALILQDRRRLRPSPSPVYVVGAIMSFYALAVTFFGLSFYAFQGSTGAAVDAKALAQLPMFARERECQGKEVIVRNGDDDTVNYQCLSWGGMVLDRGSDHPFAAWPFYRDGVVKILGSNWREEIIELVPPGKRS